MHAATSNRGSLRASDLFSAYCKRHSEKQIHLYLDIGTGYGYNTQAFSSLSEQTVGLDVRIPHSNVLFAKNDAYLMLGDGSNLPLPSDSFDMISVFSVIEHVPNQEALLKEVYRVLKPEGILVMQVPNRYFFIEVHSSIPLFYYFPSILRRIISRGFQREWVNEVNIPSIKSLVKLLSRSFPSAKIDFQRMNYSPDILNSTIKPTYKLLLKSQLLHIIPLGYLIVVKK